MRSKYLNRLTILIFGWVAMAGTAATLLADEPPATLSQAAQLFPEPGSSNVCPDTPLWLTFPSDVPTVGTGKIEVRDASDDAVVASIDVSVPTLTQTIGGVPNFKYYPVLIADHEARIVLPGGTLSYGKSYYVKIDDGVFKHHGDQSFNGISDANAWRFATKSASPTAGSKTLTVAADGSGDFATVQGAIDFIPDGNTDPITIFIRNGTYREIVCFTNKHHLTFLGENRKKTIIAYANNNNFNNNSGGNPFAPGSNPSAAPTRGGSIYRRGLFLAHRANDLTIANLTLHNTTPQGGSQAESLILNGSPEAHAVLSNLDLISYQDTLQINGQAYISNCYLEGDVDFMWGRGPCFFVNCETKSLRSNAYYTQIRNTAANHGYVFKHCKFDGDPGISGNFLSRIDPSRFPNSEVVLIDCLLTGAVGGVGWKLDGTAKEAPDVHFWEYNSHDADGKPIDTSKRLAVSKQLTLPQDQETIDHYGDAKWVLGGDWMPKVPQ